MHDGVDLHVFPGEIFGIVGGSGTGKSVLLRTILGLRRPTSGSVLVEGVDMTCADDDQLRSVKRRYGVDFPARRAVQLAHGRRENIPLPIAETMDLAEESLAALAGLRLRMVGLPVEPR